MSLLSRVRHRVRRQRGQVRGWEPAGTDEPRDQNYDDVPSKDPAVSYWGAIGPDGRPETGAWSWNIIATNDSGDQWDVDGGYGPTEDEVKRAVETWRPPR